MSNNIYWRDILPSDCISRLSHAYTVDRGGQIYVVYWHGQEATHAQTWLKNRAAKDYADRTLHPCRVCKKVVEQRNQHCWDAGLICSKECWQSLFTECPVG